MNDEMPDNVRELRPGPVDLTCQMCGSSWLLAAVTMDASMRVTGYAYPISCHECRAMLYRADGTKVPR